MLFVDVGDMLEMSDRTLKEDHSFALQEAEELHPFP